MKSYVKLNLMTGMLVLRVNTDSFTEVPVQKRLHRLQ